jgi:hypothetical protein
MKHFYEVLAGINHFGRDAVLKHDNEDGKLRLDKHAEFFTT